MAVAFGLSGLHAELVLDAVQALLKREIDAQLAVVEGEFAERDSDAGRTIDLDAPISWHMGHNPTLLLDTPLAGYPLVTVMDGSRSGTAPDRGVPAWGSGGVTTYAVLVECFVADKTPETAERKCWRYARALVYALQQQRLLELEAGLRGQQQHFEPSVDFGDVTRAEDTPSDGIDGGDPYFVKGVRIAVSVVL